MKRQTKPLGTCKDCYGYGLWPDGTAPMGPMDAGDGMPTIACPECKANANPIKKSVQVNNDETRDSLLQLRDYHQIIVDDAKLMLETKGMKKSKGLEEGYLSTSRVHSAWVKALDEAIKRV